MLWRAAPSSRRPAGFIEPRLPSVGHAVPVGHEIQHDGHRMIVRRDGECVRVFTRRGHDWTERVPPIAEAIERLSPRSSVPFRQFKNPEAPAATRVLE
jgi:ATP-dependent DNA ligase